MSKKNVHVVPHGKGQWAVREEGNPQVRSTHRTQKDAIGEAKPVAEAHRGELIIHRPNGQIRDKESYGNDPCPPKDKK